MRISDGDGVQFVEFTLTYDPALLGVIDVLPWARLSLLHEFADKELLFHLLLVPFTGAEGSTAGGRWALAALNAAVAAALAAGETPSPEMVADVQQWLDTPSTNHGWLLRGDEIGSFTAKRFDTREHPDPTLRPALRIVYTPAPPPTPTPPVPGVAVDTVNPTGVLVLAALLALAGLVALRRS